MFVSMRLYEAHLGKDLYGLILVALQLLQYLPLLDGGFRLTTNRTLLAGMDPNAEQALLVFGQTLYTWIGLLALGLGVLLMAGFQATAGVQNLEVEPGYWLALGALGAWITLGSAQTQLLIGLGMQTRLFALNTCQAWFQLGLLALAFRSGLHVWSVPISLGIAWLVSVCVAWIWIRQRRAGLPWLRLRLDHDFLDRLRQFWPSARAALRMQVVTVLLYSVDPIILLLVAPESHLALYALLARLFTILRMTLQAADEALWPILAQKTAGSRDLSSALIRLNSWLYGIMMTGAFLSVPLFLNAYMVEDWQVDSTLVGLFALRYLITGLCSQPAYFLYGAGRFHVLARFLTWELIFGTACAVGFGWVWGAQGVALGYVLGTLAGTAITLPLAYLKAAEKRAFPFFIGNWTRSLLGSGLAAMFCTFLLPQASSWVLVLLLAGVATVLSLGIVGLQAGIRARLTGKIDVQTVTQFI